MQDVETCERCASIAPKSPSLRNRPEGLLACSGAQGGGEGGYKVDATTICVAAQRAASWLAVSSARGVRLFLDPFISSTMAVAHLP